MLIIWGEKWKYKKKPGGIEISKICNNCHKGGIFFEVIPQKYFTVYWIPVFPMETKNSLLECPNCHEKFYIQPSEL